MKQHQNNRWVTSNDSATEFDTYIGSQVDNQGKHRYGTTAVAEEEVGLLPFHGERTAVN